MSSLDAVLKQYEQGQVQNNSPKNNISREDRLKKYFATYLPQGEKEGEANIRILPTSDGSSPFKEVYFHEVQVDGKWVKLMDPGKNGDGSPTGERSPLNEVEEALKLTGNQKDKEIARQYRSKKFYIVKVIDRDAEDDGVKFWRFKWNYKGDGIMDKIIPIFQKRGDITNPKEGRDLTLMLKSVPLPSGKGNYTVVSMVLAEDPSLLSNDESQVKEWVGNTETYKDVYSQKPVEYLEAVSRGETPVWDTDLKKYVYGDSETSIDMGTTTSSNTNSEKPVDPQAGQETDTDLPF
tara:strand:+ start:530 stop:1408 length:879 start_codon:yes stop_codon:yes gene_type:complete